MKLKKGDRVKMGEIGLARWGEGSPKSSNPKGVAGTITQVFGGGGLHIRVTWDNGECNSYNDIDLVLAKPRMEENE